MSSYALPLKDPAAAPLSPAGFLAGTAGWARSSAEAFLRKNPGFIARRMDFGQARELAAAAETAGFPALLTAETSLPYLPVPLAAEKIIPAEGGFTAVTAGASLFVASDSVTLICPAVYEEQVTPDTIEAVRPGVLGKIAQLAGQPPPPQPEPARETFFRADIITREGLRVLIRPEALDFSALGADRSLASGTNFRRLLDIIATPCFKALKAPLLEALAANRPLAPFRADGDEACDVALSRMLLFSAGK